MSDAERGDLRASGALANFIADMRKRLEIEGRSQEYKSQFWRSLKQEMAHIVKETS
jgi:hypothetical protein